MPDPDNNDKPTLELHIDHTQLEPGEDPPVFTFPKTEKVGEAASEAAEELGFSDEGATYTFSFKGETLDRDRPLVSFDLEDGDVVVLTDLGRAVSAEQVQWP